MPLRGWEILFAKDVIILTLALLLTHPLMPIVGMFSTLMMLAVGHATSVGKRIDQMRWRFQSGGSFASGILQMLLMTFAGFGAGHFGFVFFLLCAILYLLSIRYYGKLLRRY